jgi:hypothetical protein
MTDGPPITFPVTNTSTGAATTPFDLPQQSFLGIVTVDYDREIFGRIASRGERFLKQWAEARFPVPGPSTAGNDMPGLDVATEALPGVPDSGLGPPDAWPVVALEYRPAVNLGSVRRPIPNVSTPVPWGAEIEDMTDADRSWWLAAPDERDARAGGEIGDMARDRTVKATPSAYGIRPVDAMACIVGLSIPGQRFTDAAIQ